MKLIFQILLCSFLVVGSSYASVAVNQATAKQLQTLKGIGKKRALAIVAYRKQHGPFHVLDDLSQVKGISKGLLVKVKQKNADHLTL